MIHIIKRKFGNRLVLLAVMLFQTLMVAAADKVYISDFSIKPGETKTIAVNFDTDAENTRYIEGYIEIPEGLTVVNQNEGLGTAVKYISPNGERGVTNTSFSPNATKKVLVMSYVTITPGEGAVGYIKVAASSTLAASSTIIVRDFTASQNDNTKRTCQTGNATVTRETTDEEKLVFSFSPATLTMKAGEEKQVEVQMENGMSLTGLQSSLSVSDGLTITGVTKGERMTYGWYYSSETNNILHIGNITGNEGTVFTVSLKANSNYTGTGTLTISNIHATTSESKDYAHADIILPVTVEQVGNAALSFGTAKVYLGAGESTTVDVNLTSDTDLTGFQCTLTLPDNITATVGKGALLNSTPLYNSETGNILYIDAVGINGHAGQLFTLTLTASDAFAADGTLTLTGIHSTTASSADIASEDITMQVAIKTNPSATAPTAKTLTYNGTAQELVNAGTATGGELQYSLDGTNYSTTIPTATNAGNYTIYYRVVGDAAHNDVAAATLTATIAKAALTVTAEDKTVNYGEAAPEFTATYAGFVNNETAAVLTGTLVFDCDYSKGSNVGTYAITPKGLTAANYDITFVAGTLTVNKADAAVSTAPTAKTLTYTGVAQALVQAGTAMGGTLQYKLNDGTYAAEIPTAVNAGTYTVTYQVIGDANHYDVAGTTLTITISKAALTVTAEDMTVNYGEATPEFTATYAGFVNNETAAVLTGTLAFDCDYTPSSNIGNYTITPKGLTAANYDITFADGTLTVNKTDAAVTTAPTAKTLTYTGVAQALVQAGSAMGGTLQYKLNDGTYAAEIPTAVNAGTYTVTYQVVGDANHNDVAGTTLTITIAKAALTVTAEDKTVNYGKAAPEFTATYTGFVNNETATVLTGTLAFDCDYSKGSNVGTYAIMPKGLTAANYDITFADGTLTVNKTDAAVTTTPTAKTLTYTGVAQALVVAGNATGGTLQYKLNDGTYAAEIPTAVNAGTYTVTYQVVGDANHNDAAGTTLTITIAKAALTVTAEDKTVNYGEATPEFTATYAGFVNNETAAVLTGTLAFDCDYTPSSNIGDYAITPKGLTAANYDITFVAGTLTVTKAANFTITLAESSYIYDGTEKKPAVTVMDGSKVLTEGTDYTVAYSNNINASTNAKVTVTGKGNYDGTQIATFTISKAALTVTAEDKTVNYGGAVPKFTATYAGFVNNETAAVLTGTLAFDCDYTPSSNIGNYTITPKGLTAANYDITFVAGTLTVNKAQLTSVTLSETNLTYTGSAQTVSVTSVMAGSLVVSANDYTVSGNTATEAGTYTVTVTAKEESNFTGSATAQWSIVAIAPSTFVISSITPASFVYDGTEKKPTVTVMDGTTVLTEGTDYTVAYQNNVNAGTATVVVTGMGNYSGTQTATFTIAKAVLSSVTLAQTRLDYNGSEQSVSIASVKAGTIDVPTTDYTVSGNTATEVGTYTVTVTAKEESNFTGSVCTDFEIVQNETPELKFAIVVTDENDEVIDGTTATVTTLDEGGNAVSIDKLNVPAGNEGKSLKVYIPEQLGGYDVAAIANNAFADKDVIDVFLPDTEKSLTVGSNAIPRLATIHTTLALLDDYALMATLKPNYEAHLVMTTVKPANNYWTLGTGVDVIIPTELTIATVQQKNASEVSVCNISEEDLNMGGKRVVKSNNGVLLEGTAGESYDLVAYSGRMPSGTAITTDDHKDYGADNCLEPVVEKKHYEPGAYFVMSDNEFHAIKQEGEEIKVPAGKAVLHLTGRQGSYAPVLRLSFDSSADGISTVQSNAKEMVCYDLLGRRIQNGQQKGLIIVNGKKAIVK